MRRLTESNIVHEVGNFWVCAEDGAFTVYKIGITHSVADSAYNDLSLAVARANYLNKRYNK